MKWKTLVHAGVMFPPDYVPRGFNVKIKGRNVLLNPAQEERAWAWAKKKDTPYVKDPVFGSNFLKGFLELLPEFKGTRLEDIDFSELNEAVDHEKSLKESMAPEEKKRLANERKILREKLKEKFGWAVVDGNKFEVANYMVEPPGLFIGRGDHPLRGQWKPRVYSKDVTLNLGKEAPVPPGEWKKIVHDHDSTWLARWMDKLTDKEKYVWLSDASTIRQERDKAKYDKATKLAANIDKVVGKIYEAMASRQIKQRMVATTCFLIYRLAMRVGDEKDADEADTVGASTLRVEHVKLNGRAAEFDFLGKDSVRWQKSLPIEGRDQIVYENLKKFTDGKKPDDLLFSDITSRTVNEFFSGIQKGLSAKVFRTCLATEAVRTYLTKVDDKIVEGTPSQKLYQAKMANLQAAILCNHKRAIPKNFEESLKAKQQTLDELQAKETQTEKQAAKKEERLENLKMQLQLQVETKDYNLGTSLRNYIDPRVVVSWCAHAGLDWTKVYTKTLQKKFTWVTANAPVWKEFLAARKA